MSLKDFFKRTRAAEGADSAVEEEEEVVKPVTEKTLRKANETLQKYKAGKQALEKRLIAHEEFWKMRQWKSGVGNAHLDGDNNQYRVYSTPWLHTCIETRLCDAMDALPTCNFLPRDKNDEEEARNLSKIVPVILQRNGFERSYRNAAHYCLNHGAFILGTFWNPSANNHLGEIEIKNVDAMNLYWEPGISHIQDSSNVFYTTLVDNDHLERVYPQLVGKLGRNKTLVGRYLYDENIDTSNKSVVVDWYYHKSENGKKVLHFCKYVGETVIYSSENEGMTDGYYHHGKYPFTMNPLFPVQGSPFGYGLVDTSESTQLQIDLLNKAICDNATEGSRPRYFINNTSGLNEDEFNDPTKRIVHVENSVDENHVRQIVAADLPGIYVTHYNGLVEQLKFCTANQDVNNGAAPSGVTSYSALSALQETSGKKPRDANRNFYDGFRDSMYIMVELIRQFYTTPRQFRIDTVEGGSEYVTYTNAGLQPQKQMLNGQETAPRLPEFDIEITVEKQNPYKRLEHNEFILQMFNLGVFNPQHADQSLALVKHLDFDGKEKIVETIQQNSTMLELLLQFQKIALSLAQEVNPEIANELAQTITQANAGILGGQLPSTNVDIDTNKKHPFGEKAAAQARESTQVA